MLIKEQIDIHATPEQVWPFIVDPVIQAVWNPKIVSIERPHDGPVTIGESYKMIAKMSDKEKIFKVVVADLVEAHRLSFEHQLTEAGTGLTVTETFTLSPRGHGTRLQQKVDLRQTPIPLLLRPILWLVFRMGKPVGEPQLATLKRMIESELA